MNNKPSEEEQKIIKADEATYLGNILNSKANVIMEVEKQIQQDNITMWKPNTVATGKRQKLVTSCN